MDVFVPCEPARCVGISVPVAEDGIRVAMFREGDCGTVRIAESTTFTVQAGTEATFFAVIVNTQFRTGRTRDFRFEAAVEDALPGVQIVSPQPGTTFRADDPSLMLEATVNAAPSAIPDYPITWSYVSSDGPVVIGTTTLSGQSIVVHGLRCEDLLLRAEIDLPDGGTAFDVTPVSCVRKEETFFLNVEKGAGGMVRSDGFVWPGGDAVAEEIRVGDDAQGRGLQGNLEVTLATLPADLAAITKATLYFSVQEGVALPATNMSELRIYQVDYGDTLGADDYFTGPGVTFLPGAAGTTDFSFGIRGVDVTVAVQDAWANRAERGERVQFLMRMSDAASNGDAVANYLRIAYEDARGTYLLPALEITFENY